MVGSVNRDNYRITFDSFNNVDPGLRKKLEGYVLAVHVAEGKSRELPDFSGYDVKIDIDEGFDGSGTLYNVSLLKDGSIVADVGIGIERRVA